MKKINKFLLKNTKVVIAFVLGLVISGVGVYAASSLAPSSVSFSPPSGSSATTVQAALNDLYTKANTWINPSDFGIKRNSPKTILATPGGICIKKDGSVYCFGINNWNYEKNHVQQVFLSANCLVYSDMVLCGASKMGCTIYSDGHIGCIDNNYSSGCTVQASGSLSCS
jgi:hypothetical protein